MVKLRQIKSRFLIIFLLATLGASAINSTYIVKAESNTKTSESVKKNSENSKGKRSNKEEIKKSKSKANSSEGTGNSSETSLGGFPTQGGGIGSTPTPNKSLLPEEKKKNYVEDNRRRKTDAVIFLSDGYSLSRIKFMVSCLKRTSVNLWNVPLSLLRSPSYLAVLK